MNLKDMTIMHCRKMYIIVNRGLIKIIGRNQKLAIWQF